MKSGVSPRELTSRSGRWAALLVLPLLVNGLAWKKWVGEREELRAWRDTQVLADIRPAFSALLTRSEQMIAAWKRNGFSREDPAAAMQQLQRLGGRHYVHITQMSATGQHTSAPTGRPASLLPTISTIPLELAVTGAFGQLARWMSDVEAQPGLQIDSWTLEPDKEVGQLDRFTVHLSAFLQGGPG